MTDKPTTSQTLAIFDPTTFPKAKAGNPRRTESMPTTSSGAEVPKATMVKPIISGEILN